jgi:hypothetical protein
MLLETRVVLRTFTLTDQAKDQGLLEKPLPRDLVGRKLFAYVHKPNNFTVFIDHPALTSGIYGAFFLHLILVLQRISYIHRKRKHKKTVLPLLTTSGFHYTFSF